MDFIFIKEKVSLEYKQKFSKNLFVRKKENCRFKSILHIYTHKNLPCIIDLVLLSKLIILNIIFYYL